MELTALTMTRLEALGGQYTRPSRLDLSALAAAEQEGCPLLTGDKALREAAKKEGVEVHGTLWIAERLVETGRLSPAALGAAYAKMRARGRGLPWEEVEAQLSRLEGWG